MSAETSAWRKPGWPGRINKDINPLFDMRRREQLANYLRNINLIDSNSRSRMKFSRSHVFDKDAAGFPTPLGELGWNGLSVQLIRSTMAWCKMQNFRRTLRAMFGKVRVPPVCAGDMPQPDPSAVRQLEERIALWGYPPRHPRAAQATAAATDILRDGIAPDGIVRADIVCANDADRALVPISAFTAADLGCLAQAAMLLGLARAAEALTAAAFSRLEDQLSAQTAPAAQSLRDALMPLGLVRLTDRT